MEALARNIADQAPHQIELSEVEWNKFPARPPARPPGPPPARRRQQQQPPFPSRTPIIFSRARARAPPQDGFPNLFVTDAKHLRNRHVAFLASFHSPAVIFEQLSVIYALPKMFIASFTLVLPFFPTGTAERVENEGEIATAFTLARILSHIPLCRGGPTDLVIFDIHALQERFYFGDFIQPNFLTALPLLINELRTLPDCARARALLRVQWRR